LPEKITNAFNTYFTDIGLKIASSMDDTDIWTSERSVILKRFVKPAT
jgi:hypothetical protein